MEQLGDWYTDS